MSIMHICFISTEIFAWGKYGGFGRATRLIGRELVKRGIEVSAIVPIRKGQKLHEVLDGIDVYGFDVRHPMRTFQVYRDLEADIYHSEEPSFGTFLAKVLHPDKKHITTFRDTRLFSDWIIEFKYPSLNKLQVIFNWFYEDNFLVHWALRNNNGNFVAAHLLKERAKNKYKLKQTPIFLPTPVRFPDELKKSNKPLVIYVARWDRRKRPEMVIELAKQKPDVTFMMLGSSRDKKFGQELMTKIGQLENIILPGFVNQFEDSEMENYLSSSWILINTAAREGLPNSFIEAAAHQCAILSSVDPDQFSSRFGKFVQDDDFSSGLDYLLEEDRWKSLGQAGYEHVFREFRMEHSIDEHIRIYKSLLEGGNLNS